MTTDIKTWYKQTKVGIIPNDWEIKTISDLDIYISDWNYSSKYPKSSEFVKSWIPFIRANNLKNQTVVSNDMRFIRPELHSELRKWHLKENDVLITTRWQLWIVWIVPKEFDWANINAQIVLLRANQKSLMSKYLMYSLMSDWTQNRIKSVWAGAVLQQLPIGVLKELTLLVPTNPAEQEKIADILSSVDELIEKTDKVIETQKKLKEGLLSKLMREGIKIKTQKLKDIAKFSQWIQVDLEQQKTHHSEWYIRFLRIVDYTQETKDLRYINFPWAKYVADENDVVMVRYWASAGFIGTGKKWVIANNMFKIEPTQEILKKYLYFFLKQNKIGRLITQMSTASAMPQLNFTMIGSLEITYPEDIKEQQKIVDMLISIDSFIKDEENYKDALKILKKWLMDKLLIGEIRVKI